MTSVAIQNVRKVYGDVETIKGVSVEVPEGAFVVLVGPSGCGKSTLLRMIAGLEDISGGVIRIGGKVINDVEPKNRDIAMVFQNYALYPHMTIAENMGFSLKLAKRPKAEIETRVADAARILGLTDYLKRYPKQLSGGQRQRVAMGRAIVRDPKVYLFDEPLSNLDAKLRVQMRAELKDIHTRFRTTTVYVTHDQIEAMTMADQIVVMRDGVIEQVGTPLDIYDYPANVFVASFIGSPAMNFFDGTVSADGTTVVTADGIALPLPEGVKPAAGLAVRYGVRPEKLFLAESETDGIEMSVAAVEPTGSETFIKGRLGKQEISVQLRERVRVSPGDTLRLRYATGDAHLFDATTEAVIR
ncbi:ABC transporter ATP-binding protein [Martelella endophytica]|uniref:Sugar ABC transporter ATP-binding protein n=1 Tax=Martelella endophytica TaxID=1486262 RepID=A0A0D5LMG2_MAREN|nr:sn-glycerol-3-phosphate ABC transporter ATP-binding protein UgpC [Martelella endophytica]AJY44952.1 sugar ABC transporter ATP-binding protein [Martelella endophytica]